MLYNDQRNNKPKRYNCHFYAPITGASKYMEQLLTNLKEDFNKTNNRQY